MAESLKTVLLLGGGWPLGLLLVANAFLFSFLCQRLGVAICLRPLRKLQTDHWAEKARASYPAWVSLSAGLFMLGVLSIIQAGAFSKHMSFPGAGAMPWLSITSSFLASGLVSSRTESRLKERKITLGDWLRQALIPLLLLIPHYVMLFWLAVSAPDQFTARVWIFVGIALLVLMFYTFGGGLIVGKWLGLVRVAPERVARVVEVAAQRVGVRPKAAYVLRWKAANALAFTITQAVAFSDTAVEHCDDEELVAICIHELGHLNESRRVKRLRVLGTFMWLPVVCAKPILGTFGIPGVAVLALYLLFGHRAVRHLCRKMEERADAISSAHEGESGTYARALERLYELNLVPAVMRQKRAVHPHLYDRLLAAGIVPTYPRPAPPSRWRAMLSILAMLVCATIYMFACGVALTMIFRE